MLADFASDVLCHQQIVEQHLDVLKVSEPSEDLVFVNLLLIESGGPRLYMNRLTIKPDDFVSDLASTMIRSNSCPVLLLFDFIGDVHR